MNCGEEGDELQVLFAAGDQWRTSEARRSPGWEEKTPWM